MQGNEGMGKIERGKRGGWRGSGNYKEKTEMREGRKKSGDMSTGREDVELGFRKKRR